MYKSIVLAIIVLSCFSVMAQTDNEEKPEQWFRSDSTDHKIMYIIDFENKEVEIVEFNQGESVGESVGYVEYDEYNKIVNTWMYDKGKKLLVDSEKGNIKIISK